MVTWNKIKWELKKMYWCYGCRHRFSQDDMGTDHVLFHYLGGDGTTSAIIPIRCCPKCNCHNVLSEGYHRQQWLTYSNVEDHHDTK